MHLSTPQFEPLFDRSNFPLLAAGYDALVVPLGRCESLAFCHFPDQRAAKLAIAQEGRDWPNYGDVRWPWAEVWTEFDMGPLGFNSLCGVLITRTTIPSFDPDPLEWVASNTPLGTLFPELRGEEEIMEMAELLQMAAVAPPTGDGPKDEQPCYVQSYCLFRKQGDKGAGLDARYTDILNKAGQIIPRYRTTLGEPVDLRFRHCALHAVCVLNAERQRGLSVVGTEQLTSLSPIRLAADSDEPNWSRFHPMRIMRTMPALRSIPVAGALTNGYMTLETMQLVQGTLFAERNHHILAIRRDLRNRVSLQQVTNDATTAFVHKCHGGAIYSIPDALTEEFLHTDCSEVDLSDLNLPFQFLYISFKPPESLVLEPGAHVDGCYVSKQSTGEPGSLGELLLVLTSRKADTDYGRSLSVCTSDPTFSIHLPIGDETSRFSVNSAVGMGIESFLQDNAPPEDDLSQDVTLEDGRVVRQIDIRAQSRRRRIETFRSQESVFRTCLNIIVNALCFISFRPEDITEEWDRDPPAWVIEALADSRDNRSARDRRASANRLISNHDYTRIKICGKSLFQNAHTQGSTGHGPSPRAHWRRGHWRRQRHGPSLSLTVLRWIRPTLVKQENGQVTDARIYEVDRDSGPSS